ncbi:MAG: response regulator transcription factor [Chloroflexota bacterium]
MNPIRIVLAEDHIIVRKGIYSLLTQQPDMEVVGEASTGYEAVALAESTEADIILMDINMPELNGLEATRQIRRLQPSVKVLVLTMYSNEEYVLQLLQAGAAGYVVKQSIPAELITAIRAVHEGNTFLSPLIAKGVIDAYLHHAPAAEQGDNYSKLTDREREVLQLLVEGFGVREIAVKLFISTKTVGVHRANLMEKLEVNNMVDLVKYALRKGVIRLE